MFHSQKRRKSCCPNGHILQEEVTKTKLNKFLSFLGDVNYIKIHVPSSLKCTRCYSTIFADHQPTFATCEQCDFHLCRSCTGDSISPVSSMEYNGDDFDSRKRKGRNDQCDMGHQMSFEFQDPNIVNPDNRYNNMRPNYNLFPRVQYGWYPEPSNFGWRFTGSCEVDKVEYYEREVENGIVYLDFYFMTGTARTIVNHRIDGQITLFGRGKSLLPDVYQKILLNPMFSDRGFRGRG